MEEPIPEPPPQQSAGTIPELTPSELSSPAAELSPSASVEPSQTAESSKPEPTQAAEGVAAAPTKSFEFKSIAKVEKKPGNYWVYYVMLETNYPSYLERKGKDAREGAVTAFQQERRYKEFEWLHKALQESFPTYVVPPLPGLGLEGVLDKMDNIIGTDLDILPALVTFRMKGLTLFLKWLAKSPQLRDSLLVRNFVVMSESELDKFRSSKEAKSASGKGLLFDMKKHFTAPKTLDSYVEKVRDMMTKSVFEMKMLKDKLEKTWDDIVNNCEHNSSHGIIAVSDPSKDPVISAINKLASATLLAVSTFSEKNEELFLALVVDITFCCGLCDSVRAVTAHIEELALIAEKHPPSPSGDLTPAQQSLNAAILVLKDEFLRYSHLKKPLLKRIAWNMARLCSSFDPADYEWDTKCTQPVLDIPDLEGWSE